MPLKANNLQRNVKELSSLTQVYLLSLLPSLLLVHEPLYMNTEMNAHKNIINLNQPAPPSPPQPSDLSEPLLFANFKYGL